MNLRNENKISVRGNVSAEVSAETVRDSECKVKQYSMTVRVRAVAIYASVGWGLKVQSCERGYVSALDPIDLLPSL